MGNTGGNAGGLIRMRPITTHARQITDYASYRGMLILSGVDATEESAEDTTMESARKATVAKTNPHLVRSDDGRVALWAGTVDDLWKFGKPTGHGGPWQQTAVQSQEVSDPFLMNGFDHKRLTLTRHATNEPVADAKPITVSLEVDIDGTGHFERYETVELSVDTLSRKSFRMRFPLIGYDASLMTRLRSRRNFTIFDRSVPVWDERKLRKKRFLTLAWLFCEFHSI